MSLEVKKNHCSPLVVHVDNTDHNTISLTAKDSFHGTVISLTEHPTGDLQGIGRNRVLINDDIPKRKTVSNLPDAYTVIEPYLEQLAKKDYYVPGGCNANKPQSNLVPENLKCEYQWLMQQGRRTTRRRKA